MDPCSPDEQGSSDPLKDGPAPARKRTAIAGGACLQVPRRWRSAGQGHVGQQMRANVHQPRSAMADQARRAPVAAPHVRPISAATPPWLKMRSSTWVGLKLLGQRRRPPSAARRRRQHDVLTAVRASATSRPVGFHNLATVLTCGLCDAPVLADQPSKDRSAPDSLVVEVLRGMIGRGGRSRSVRRGRRAL